MYQEINVHVSPHPGASDVWVVTATRYRDSDGNEWDQDDSEEIRGRENALSYARIHADYQKGEHPNASVVVFDDQGEEYYVPRG